MKEITLWRTQFLLTALVLIISFITSISFDFSYYILLLPIAIFGGIFFSVLCVFSISIKILKPDIKYINIVYRISLWTLLISFVGSAIYDLQTSAIGLIPDVDFWFILPYIMLVGLTYWAIKINKRLDNNMNLKQTFKLKEPWLKIKVFKLNTILIYFLKIIILLIFIIASLVIIKNEFYSSNSTESIASKSLDFFTNNSSDGSCNVMGIELHGDLITYIDPANKDENGDTIVDETASENVVLAIKDAESDNNVKAIIIEIDSYGGTPLAGEEISDAIKNAKKPTIALIRGAGLSAGYLSATGANIIFASKNSDVGSIGVTMSYLSSENSNGSAGLTYNNLSSGKFKDSGDPDKILTPEEKQLFMRDVNILHQNFVQAVAENRNLDIKKVEILADGSSMLGEMALQNSLIDRIGGMLEIIKYLEEKIGQDVDICW